MEFKIKRDSNFSIHIQLKEQIKGFILNEVIEKGSQLPTVRQLEKMLRINKNTVSKVYKDLELEGYVYSVKGKGTFVKEKKNTKQIEQFINDVDILLKKALRLEVSLEELWGIIYYRSQKQKIYNLDQSQKGFLFVECNMEAIKDFEAICKSELREVEIKGVLINDIKNKFENLKNISKEYKFVVIPYLHYEEVKKELKLLNKEVITIGTSQSLKILSFAKKLKNKTVGIIGLSLEDEIAISKQFHNIEVKEFVYFNAINNKHKEDLLRFEARVDSLIIYSEVLEKINYKPKKDFFKYEGKYDIEDMKIIKDIFGE